MTRILIGMLIGALLGAGVVTATFDPVVRVIERCAKKADQRPTLFRI